MAFAVVEGGLNGSGNRWEPVDDLGPCLFVEAPVAEGITAVLVVVEAGGGVEFGGEVLQGGDERRSGRVGVEPLVEVFSLDLMRASGSPCASNAQDLWIGSAGAYTPE
ncbi:hypothetical protein [Actinomadura harenae]|uniref:Uncharacterized protein n=1 Tax=Actinomadura harenae TaxID=2483351 RepID=A0A3M2L6X8_9ACTN|nr:hypothetical protein [Actinomadura harenae]RMI32480.1 hypothetical protein EBO15_41965 [Actinomadura harenae]